MSLLAPAAAHAQPRLLMSYPADGGVYGQPVDGVTFVFSEPMDPTSVVQPNAGSSNPNRSFEVVRTDCTSPTGCRAGSGYTAGSRPVALQGGRVIEIPGSTADVGPGVEMHVFPRGFRSITGEPLDHGYTIRGYVCMCVVSSFDLLRAALPAAGQPGADGAAPLSIYFGQPVDASTFQVQLRTGYAGGTIGPLEFHWDLPAGAPEGTGFLHLTVDHPPLTASARPYVFQTLSLFRPPDPQTNNMRVRLDGLSFAFTVGPRLAGDLNGDGQVTAGDVVLVLRAALGLASLTDAQEFAADVSPRYGTAGRAVGDGRVTVADAARILQRAVGLVTDDQWP